MDTERYSMEEFMVCFDLGPVFPTQINLQVTFTGN